jgi:uncharacterized protein (TIGR03067 family)
MLKGGPVTLTGEATMKIRVATAVLLGVALASASVAVGGDAKADLKKFQGTWAVESAKEMGKEVPVGKLDNVRFVFAGDKITVKHGDKGEEGTFKIDPGKKPKHIDVTVKGKTHPGIYAYQKGKLQICIGDEGGERPTKFEAPAGSKTSFVVLKRAKK